MVRAPVGVVLTMVCLTTAASFVLTTIRELTGSMLPAAATYGALNAVASLLTLTIAGGNLLLGGVLGASGSLALGFVALPLWIMVRLEQQ